MKVRNGFVSNSSSSSFLIFSNKKLESVQDWEDTVFNSPNSIRWRDIPKFWDTSKKTLFQTCKDSLVKVTTENEYIEEGQTDALEVFEIKNFIELLEDSSSWLVKELQHAIRWDVREIFNDIEPSMLGGKLFSNFRFDYYDRVFGLVSDYNEEVNEILDKATLDYVSELSEYFKCYSKGVHFYLICTHSDSCPSEDDYATDGAFLRSNWDKLVSDNVEYFRFECS